MGDEIIDVETVERWLDFGQETPSIEWKSATSWNTKDAASLKIVRGMMAISNLRQGGRVLVGVTEKRGADGVTRPKLDCMTETQAATLTYDKMADFVRATSDPPVVFERHLVEMKPGCFVVVLDVEEFENEPVICVKSRHTSTQEMILQEGAVYYRNHGSIASKPVASAADMRDLLRLATDKKLQRYRQIHKEVETAAGSSEAFRRESEDF